MPWCRVSRPRWPGTDLAEAAFALKVPEEEGGIPWIATNTDWTIPRERGVAPGNGTLVSAVHTAIGRLATVAGKPEVPIFEEATERFGAKTPLFIGDRLGHRHPRRRPEQASTRRSCSRASIVPKHVLAAPEGSRPTYILSDLRELHQPYPEVTSERRRAFGERCIGARGRGRRRDHLGGRLADRPAARPAQQRSGPQGLRSSSCACPNASTTIRSTGPEPPVIECR